MFHCRIDVIASTKANADSFILKAFATIIFCIRNVKTENAVNDILKVINEKYVKKAVKEKVSVPIFMLLLLVMCKT